MDKFTVTLISALVVALNYQFVNGGHTYREDLQLNIENIRNVYASVPLNQNTSQNGAIETTACHQGFCCHFKIEYQDMEYNPSNATSLGYSVFAYKGLATFSNTVHNTVEICGINRMTGEDNEQRLAFGISGVLENKNSTVFPSFKTASDDKFIHYKSYERQVLKYKQNDDSVNFEYLTDNEEGVFETLLLMGTNLPLETLTREDSPDINVVLDMSNVVNQVEELSLMDYFYIRLQILAFVITIYCLEQM